MRFRYNGGVAFLIIVVLYISISLFDQTYIFTKDFIDLNYDLNISQSALVELMHHERKINWIGYLLIPFIIFLKTLFATICISIGVLLSNKQFSFGKLFKDCMIAEYVFLSSQLIYSINLYVNRENNTIESAAGYFPLNMLPVIQIFILYILYSISSKRIRSWLANT